MNPLNWKKATPFLKKFARKVKKRFKPDLDDIHDTGDKLGSVQEPSLWEKGLTLGLDLMNPVSRAIALSRQSLPGEFVHEVANKTIGQVNPYSSTANTSDWQHLDQAAKAREMGGQWQVGGIKIPEFGLSEYMGFNAINKDDYDRLIAEKEKEEFSEPSTFG